MTYQKANPIWRTTLKPVTFKMPISRSLDLDSESGLRAPYNTPTDLCCLLSIPIAETMSPSISAEVMLAELHALASSKALRLSSLPSPTNSSTPAEDDDDYDNCDEYDNGFGDFESNTFFVPTSTQQQDELSRDFDDASSTSSSDEDEEASSSASLADDLDYFGFDFEASPLDTSPDSQSPRPSLSELPHWWGEEDQEHLAAVLTHYDHTTAIDAERKKNIRAPAPFVGRVVRHQVPSVDGLQSLDEVFIYRYELIPFGQTMPLIRTHWVVTTWDQASGLPLHQAIVSNKVADSVWLPRARSNNITTIFCEPDASSPSSFVLSIDRDGTTRGTISIGYFNSYNSWSRFFPESAFHHTLPEDD